MSQRGAGTRTSPSHVLPPPAGRPEAGGGDGRAGAHGGQGALVRAAGGARPDRPHRADEAQSVADRAHPLPLGGSGAAGWGGGGACSPRRLCGCAAAWRCSLHLPSLAAPMQSRARLLPTALAVTRWSHTPAVHHAAPGRCPLRPPSPADCTRRCAALTIAGRRTKPPAAHDAAPGRCRLLMPLRSRSLAIAGCICRCSRSPCGARHHSLPESVSTMTASHCPLRMPSHLGSLAAIDAASDRRPLRLPSLVAHAVAPTSAGIHCLHPLSLLSHASQPRPPAVAGRTNRRVQPHISPSPPPPSPAPSSPVAGRAAHVPGRHLLVSCGRACAATAPALRLCGDG
jgi:hypothetical protein